MSGRSLGRRVAGFDERPRALAPTAILCNVACALNASRVRPDETSSNQEVQFLPRQGPASQRESSSALCEATTTAKRE